MYWNVWFKKKKVWLTMTMQDLECSYQVERASNECVLLSVVEDSDLIKSHLSFFLIVYKWVKESAVRPNFHS